MPMHPTHYLQFRVVRTATQLIALCAMMVTPKAFGAPAGVQKGEWNGYEQHNFNVGGRGALLVIPKKPAEGNPWIWRTEFFGVDPQADIALLDKGVYVGYIGVGGLFGAPVALDAMDLYYDFVCENYHLSAKTVPQPRRLVCPQLGNPSPGFGGLHVFGRAGVRFQELAGRWGAD